MRLINWNIERRGPHQWQAASLLSEIEALSPDLVCLTEAHVHSLDSWGWHTLSHEGYRPAHKKASERLVVLGSRQPWEPVPVPERLQAVGGLIIGRTQIGGQDLMCACICLPYHMARLPDETRTSPWKHHTAFIEVLTPWLAEFVQSVDIPLIMAGDYNRRLPSKWGLKSALALLEDCFAGFTIVTRGDLAPLNVQTIDHVAFRGGVTAREVVLLDRHAGDGRPRSDHHGVRVDFDVA